MSSDHEDAERSKKETDVLIQSMENNLLCPICHDYFKQATTLNCTHSFCYNCIRNWRQTKNECPICRIQIDNLTASLALDNLVSAYTNQEKVKTEIIIEDNNRSDNQYVISNFEPGPENGNIDPIDTEDFEGEFMDEEGEEEEEENDYDFDEENEEDEFEEDSEEQSVESAENSDVGSENYSFGGEEEEDVFNSTGGFSDSSSSNSSSSSSLSLHFHLHQSYDYFPEENNLFDDEEDEDDSDQNEDSDEPM